MKIKILNLTKKYLGEITLTTGTGLFIYNIFNFSYTEASGKSIWDNSGIGEVAYYYSLNTLILISIGAILIISGILIIKNK